MESPVTGTSVYDLDEETGQLVASSELGKSEECTSTSAFLGAITGAGSGVKVGSAVGLSERVGNAVCVGSDVMNIAVSAEVGVGVWVTITIRVTSTTTGVAVGNAYRVARTASWISSGDGSRGCSDMLIPRARPANASPSSVLLNIAINNEFEGDIVPAYDRGQQCEGGGIGRSMSMSAQWRSSMKISNEGKAAEFWHGCVIAGTTKCEAVPDLIKKRLGELPHMHGIIKS